MAVSDEPKARYPKVDPDTLQPGAKHGYLGEVEVYDPKNPGHSNTETGKASKGDSAAPIKGVVGMTKSSDDDSADDTPGTKHQ